MTANPSLRQGTRLGVGIGYSSFTVATATLSGDATLDSAGWTAWVCGNHLDCETSPG